MATICDSRGSAVERAMLNLLSHQILKTTEIRRISTGITVDTGEYEAEDIRMIHSDFPPRVSPRAPWKSLNSCSRRSKH